MPLAMVSTGETKVISCFKGADDMKRRLQELGFVKGEKIQVVGENASGLILVVKGARVALNRALANKIIVQD